MITTLIISQKSLKKPLSFKNLWSIESKVHVLGVGLPMLLKIVINHPSLENQSFHGIDQINKLIDLRIYDTISLHLSCGMSISHST
jgi:hypothetical protein